MITTSTQMHRTDTVSYTSDIGPVSNHYFLDIIATIDCGFTLKRVRDMIITFSQMNRTNRYCKHSSIISAVSLNGWVFVYELSGCGFEFRSIELNLRYRAYFEQRVPRHLRNYRLWNHSEMCTWRDNNHDDSTNKYSQYSSIIWPIWPNGWVFVPCKNLFFRYRACFEQRVPRHSDNYRVRNHSKMRTWHDKKIQSNARYR